VSLILKCFNSIYKTIYLDFLVQINAFLDKKSHLEVLGIKN